MRIENLLDSNSVFCFFSWNQKLVINQLVISNNHHRYLLTLSLISIFSRILLGVFWFFRSLHYVRVYNFNRRIILSTFNFCNNNRYVQVIRVIYYSYLQAMVAHGRVELLAHPLSEKYLEMKWNSYGKYFHLVHLLLYSIFLILVTFFSSNLMSDQLPKPADVNQNVTQSILLQVSIIRPLY